MKDKNITSLPQDEINNAKDGHWIINFATGATYFAYQLGKDSYHIHPRSKMMEKLKRVFTGEEGINILFLILTMALWMCIFAYEFGKDFYGIHPESYLKFLH